MCVADAADVSMYTKGPSIYIALCPSIYSFLNVIMSSAYLHTLFVVLASFIPCAFISRAEFLHSARIPPFRMRSSIPHASLHPACIPPPLASSP